MKKIIPILFLFFTIYIIQNEEDIVIPNDAIRFRVIANSNTLKDQQQKLVVKEHLEDKLNALMLEAKTNEEAKNLIKENLETIRKTVDEIEPKNKVNFGLNYFPEKEYKGITYPKGEYESLVVTLGNGEGKNWWCVMFPPLCLLDQKENADEIDYKLFVTEIIKKYKA